MPITRADVEKAMGDLEIQSCPMNTIVLDQDAAQALMERATTVINAAVGRQLMELFVAGAVVGYQLAVAEQRRLVGNMVTAETADLSKPQINTDEH